MTGLADFREQHPEYDDMSDLDLASRLHTKFYSDIPTDTFYQKLGVTPPQPQTSGLGAFIHHAGAEALPTLGGIGAGITGGSALGAGLGSIAPGIGNVVGGIGGALLGGIAGGAAVQKAQDWAVNQLPISVQKALGQDAATRQAEETQHPYASLAGGVAPQLAAFRVGGVGGAARALNAALMGGTQAGQEYEQNGQIDPTSVALAAGLGALQGEGRGPIGSFANATHQLFHGVPEAAPAPRGTDLGLAQALNQGPAPQLESAEPAPGPAAPQAQQENNTTAIQRKMQSQPVTQVDQHSVVQDRLNQLAASSPTGKNAADEIQTKLNDGSLDPTQAYMAIHHIGGAIQDVLGGTDANIGVKILPDILHPQTGERAQGLFYPGRNLLEFSVHPSALEYANETGAHEVWHFFQQTYARVDPQADRVLAKAFTDQTTPDSLNPSLKRKMQATAYPVQPPDAAEPVTYWDKMIEGNGGADKPFGSRLEAEAHVFGAIDSMRNYGQQVTLIGPAQRFSKFVGDVKTRIKNGLAGDGIQTPEDVMNAYSGGKAGAAKAGSAAPVPGLTPPSEQGEVNTPAQLQEDYRIQPPLYSSRSHSGADMYEPGSYERSVNFQNWFRGAHKDMREPNGSPRTFYHSTYANFDQFDTGRREIGSHFGTAEQAEDRNRVIFNDPSYSIGEDVQYIPVNLNIKNPVRVPDLGYFEPSSLANHLLDQNILTPIEASEVYDASRRKPDDDVESYYKSDVRLASPWEKRGTSKLKEILATKGYDGMVYKNIAEGHVPMDSYIAFRPDQIKSIYNYGGYNPLDPRMQFSTRKVGEARAFPAYSHLTRSLENIPQKSATAEQWQGIINNLKNKGVKSDEIEWSGINDFLNSYKPESHGVDKEKTPDIYKQVNEPISKEKILQHLKQNNLNLEMNVLGGRGAVPEAQAYAVNHSEAGLWRKSNMDVKLNGRLMRLTHYAFDLPGGRKATIRFEPQSGEYKPFLDGVALPETTSFGHAARLINMEMGSPYRGPAKFPDRASPGGEPGSYREAFLTAPESDKYENWQDGHTQYSHIKNPVVRVRFDSRTDPDGSRRMHIAEIQPPKEDQKMPPGLRARALEMGMKWALFHAAANGYDRVSWDNGETQRIRYGEAYTHLRKIAYDTRDHRLQIHEYGQDPERDEPAQELHITPDKLTNAIPAEFAKRLLDKPGENKVLKGQDLVFQGTGLKNLYDKKLPELVAKYGKKWGLSVENIPGGGSSGKHMVVPEDEDTGRGPYHVINSVGDHIATYGDMDDADAHAAELDRIAEKEGGQPVHSVKVTPELRDSLGANEEEQPLWSRRKTDFDGDTPLPPDIVASRRKAQLAQASIPGLDQAMERVYGPEKAGLSLLQRTQQIGSTVKDPSFWERLYAQTVDKNVRLSDLDKAWMQKHGSALQPGIDWIDRSTGKQLTLQMSSYKMRSMADRVAAHAGTDMFTTVFGLRKQGDFTTSNVNAKGELLKPTVQSGPYKGREIDGLMKTWAPAYKAGVGDLFHFYMDANRGLRLLGEGREKLFTAADQALAKQLEQKFNGQNGLPNFREMADLTHEFNRAKLDSMVTAGVITRAGADHYLKTGDYTPFYREFEKEGVAGPVYVDGVNTGQSVLHTKLKGSDAKLGDPLDRWYRHLMAMNHAMLSNESAARAMDQAMDVGMARLAKVGDTENIITVRRNGDKIKYVVDDPLLHEALASIDGRPVSAMMKIFQIPTNILRQFTTHVPTFILMHSMRESFTGFVTSDGKPIIPIIDAIRGIKNSLMNSTSAQAIQNHGITGNFDYRPGIGQGIGDKLRERAATQLGLKINHANSFLGLMHGVWDKYEQVLKAADAGVRTRVYENEMAKHGNPAEAAYQAGAKAVNFQRRGASPFMSYAFSAIPFLNARIQGTDLILRTMANQYQNKGLGGVLFSRGMALAAMTAAYYLSVRNNDTYKRAASIYKDGYWIVPMDMFGGQKGEAFVLPIPFEAGVLYKNVPEHIMRAYFGDDKAEDLQRAATTAMMDTLQFNPIPQVARPALEAMTNYSFYTGRQIVPEGMQMPGARQYEVEPNTSMMAREIGKATGTSPIKIDYLVRGYLGTVGEWAMEASDAAGRAVGNAPPLPNQYFDNPTASNMPFLKRFVRNSRQLGDEELDRLYDLHGESQGLVRSLNRLTAAGDSEAAQDMVQNNRGTLAVKDVVNQVFGQIARLNKMEMNIQAMPASRMDAATKDQYLKQLEERKYLLAQQVEKIRSIRNNVGAQ